MRDYIIYLVILLLFAFSLRSRTVGIYTYWWIAIFRPHDWVWGTTLQSLRISLICLLLVAIPSLIQKKTPRLLHPLSILMFLWLTMLIIADTVNSCDELTTFRPISLSALFVLFYMSLLTTTLVSDYKKLFWFIAVMSFSIASHSSKGGIIALITGANYWGLFQLTGLFQDSNLYALGSSMLLFFMIFTYQQIDSSLVYKQMNKWYNKPFSLKMLKLLIVILILGTMYNVIALSSRGSFLAMAVGLVLWMNLQKKKIRNNIVLALIIVCGLTVAPLPEGYKDRILSAFKSKEKLDKSAASRPHFWQTAEKIVADHPLGVGPGCFPAYYNLYDSSRGFYGLNRSVHSSHYQILNDSGYFGFILWLLLFLVSFWKLLNIRRLSEKLLEDKVKYKFYFDFSNMLLCSQTVFLLGGSFYEYAYNDITWLVFGLVIAIEIMFKREIKLKKAINT